ncbi:MAG: hypothetical protein SGPRY_005535, partial [Prymnesium sp.]
GAMLGLLYEWAVGSCNEGVVRGVEEEASRINLSLHANPALAFRELIYKLEMFGAERVQASHAEVLAWVDELCSLAASSRDLSSLSTALRHSIRTQIVLQHLSTDGADWRGAKRALCSLFKDMGPASCPDEMARYRVLDSAIRAAQKQQLEELRVIRARNPPGVLREQATALVCKLKRMLKPPELQRLNLEERQPFGAELVEWGERQSLRRGAGGEQGLGTMERATGEEDAPHRRLADKFDRSLTELTGGEEARYSRSADEPEATAQRSLPDAGQHNCYTPNLLAPSTNMPHVRLDQRRDADMPAQQSSRTLLLPPRAFRRLAEPSRHTKQPASVPSCGEEPDAGQGGANNAPAAPFGGARMQKLSLGHRIVNEEGQPGERVAFTDDEISEDDSSQGKMQQARLAIAPYPSKRKHRTRWTVQETQNLRRAPANAR